MTNPLKRGSAPNRAQPDYARPGSFKPGHEKRGGRKRGTPNLISADYKKAILEAAYRVGQDGNGKDGVVGYFWWVGERHPGIFYPELYTSVLPLEDAASDTPEEPRQTIEELNQWFRDDIGLTGDNRTKRQTIHVESQGPWDWTGQPDPVGGLMRLAVESPKAFCTLVSAVFLRLPTKRRGLAANRSEPQAGAA